jgi:integrase/recombinase XerC
MLRIPGQLFFPGRQGGPLANNVLNRWYATLCDQAEVTKITSHGVRHTAGSSYAYLGAGNKAIATLLGRENMSSSERYTHMQAEGTADLAAARWARLSGK